MLFPDMINLEFPLYVLKQTLNHSEAEVDNVDCDSFRLGV